MFKQTMNVWGKYNTINKSFKDDISDEPNIKTVDSIDDELDYKKDLLSQEKCKYCNRISIIYEDGKKICSTCGYINGQILDMSQEWRYYGSDDNKRSSDPNRCGMANNSLFNGIQFGAIMRGYGNEKYRKLLRWNSIQYKAKSLMAVCKFIQEACNEGNIPNCVSDKAKLMYKIISNDIIKRGISRHSLIAACVFYSCKDKEISRKRREISNLFEISVKKMTIGCNKFKEIMFSKNPDFVNNLKPSSTEDFIRRNCVLLKIPHNYRNIIIYCSSVAEKLGIVMDNIPSSISVGSIYLVSQHYNLNITKKMIANICNTSQVTVSKTYKIMKVYKKYLLPILV